MSGDDRPTYSNPRRFHSLTGEPQRRGDVILRQKSYRSNYVNVTLPPKTEANTDQTDVDSKNSDSNNPAKINSFSEFKHRAVTKCSSINFPPTPEQRNANTTVPSRAAASLQRTGTTANQHRQLTAASSSPYMSLEPNQAPTSGLRRPASMHLTIATDRFASARSANSPPTAPSRQPTGGRNAPQISGAERISPPSPSFRVHRTPSPLVNTTPPAYPPAASPTLLPRVAPAAPPHSGNDYSRRSTTDAGNDRAGGERTTRFAFASESRSEPSTAIYGAAQGRGCNLLMELKGVQEKLRTIYQSVEQEPCGSAQIAELRNYLRIPEHVARSVVRDAVHKSLEPARSRGGSPHPQHKANASQLYVVDFCEFNDRRDLCQQIVDMFARPGPPSIRYEKVDTRLHGTIDEFARSVAELRAVENACVTSPAHARLLMRGLVEDADPLVKALCDNQLWIRWGTASGLPPLSHLYMHKDPPSYEVRKSVTLSMIAEKVRATPHLLPRGMTSSQRLCPPIYGRLAAEGISMSCKWQVTEYSEEDAKMQTRECSLPSWLDEDSAAISLLNSTSRSTFKKGEHPYALYAVYLIIIKDITLCERDLLMPQVDKRGTASKFQYYVGSSSTGAMFKFQHTDESHCARASHALLQAADLRHYRCYDGCDLVEACMALSYLRRQPSAVFVLNSYLSAKQSSLSLERKKPAHDKMTALEHRLATGGSGKLAVGSLYNMQVGMNGTTTLPGLDELE